MFYFFSSVSLAHEFKQQDKFYHQQVESDTLKTTSSSNSNNFNDIVYPKRQSISYKQDSSVPFNREKLFVPVGDKKNTNNNVPSPNPIQPK
jgi:hypothetical protein